MELSKNVFEKVADKDKNMEEIVRPSLTFLQDAWARFKKNKLAMVSLIAIGIIVLLAVFGPMFSKYDLATNNFKEANQSPNAAHWFGTDKFGRDLFVRVLYGARISLTVGIVASALNFFIGVLYGGISGYFGGKIDNVMMRFIEILSAIPFTLTVILIKIILNSDGMKGIIIALAVVNWVTMARIVRGQVLALKEQEFILAAKTLGASHFKIILKHLLPNSLGPIIVTLTLAVPDAIFTESFLSFIGLGVSAPQASWGTLASDAVPNLSIYPHLLFFPAAAICITILAFNLLGDGLRDALDPKMRK